MTKKRWFWLGAIAILSILLITIIAAPTTNQLNSGSTYNRAPEGYGAWYQFMQQKRMPVTRWRKPFSEMAKTKSPATLLRVNSSLDSSLVGGLEEEWVKKGNTLVVLGTRSRVTAAKFSSFLESPNGKVKIETTRRRELAKEERGRLRDRYGTVVWEKAIGKGRVIYATTPHLAANAYQDEPGNYEFLAQLVSGRVGEGGSGRVGEKGFTNISTTNQQPVKISQAQNQIWVDEYIHGYKDQTNEFCQPSEAPKNAPKSGNGSGGRTNSKQPQIGKDGKKCGEDSQEDWISYLSKTPLFPVAIQAGMILIVLILGKNQRFGAPLALTAPTVDNSEAYIQAVAEVLRKAETKEFVVELVGKEEQLQLQKSLGLGTDLLDNQTLVAAWTQQTGRPSGELQQIIDMQSRGHQISETDLLSWLEKWQKIRNG